MRLLQRAVLLVPAIRRLRDSRDILVAERDALLGRIATADVEASKLAAAGREQRLIVTEYPYYPRSRAIENSASGERLASLFQANADRYAKLLHGMARHIDALLQIPREESGQNNPYWENDLLPPFDAISLYGLIAETSPKRYIEVGAGMSTRFARRAIADLCLPTRIVSIDPYPPTAIHTICDQMLRLRMEDVPREFWEEIGPEDLLFVDNSHRSFPNSDVTVFFSEGTTCAENGDNLGSSRYFSPVGLPRGVERSFL